MSDAANRLLIGDSCKVICSHAAFICSAASKIGIMPSEYEPPCLSELTQAESVMRHALCNIERAKAELAAKRKKAA